MKIKYRKLTKLSNDELKKLIPISHRNGYIRKVFKYISLPSKHQNNFIKYYSSMRISIAYNRNGNPIGWALIDTDGTIILENNLLCVFVKKEYRNRGLGKILVEHISKRMKIEKTEMKFAPWDNTNAQFFIKCGLIIENRIT